ncbi:hypothetical protein JIQ42_06518 [Leishmania sp. Namibia]|uniref:hypothetical protein n=1 Tax=Leishmania sp. Namibia TaxID=2802991 RepID=UPI001B797CE4|nr:hypothetical protein JIQ42_06518 [Leishmania sp. Namibia]
MRCSIDCPPPLSLCLPSRPALTRSLNLCTYPLDLPRFLVRSSRSIRSLSFFHLSTFTAIISSLSLLFSTVLKMPPKHNENEDDYVPPCDKAEKLAMEYENAHHERPGMKKHNETPSHQCKPKSVR